MSREAANACIAAGTLIWALVLYASMFTGRVAPDFGDPPSIVGTALMTAGIFYAAPDEDGFVRRRYRLGFHLGCAILACDALVIAPKLLG